MIDKTKATFDKVKKVDCHFLPATDQLAVTSLRGIWLFNAADIKKKAKSIK